MKKYPLIIVFLLFSVSLGIGRGTSDDNLVLWGGFPAHLIIFSEAFDLVQDQYLQGSDLSIATIEYHGIDIDPEIKVFGLWRSKENLFLKLIRINLSPKCIHDRFTGEECVALSDEIEIPFPKGLNFAKFQSLAYSGIRDIPSSLKRSNMAKTIIINSGWSSSYVILTARAIDSLSHSDELNQVFVLESEISSFFEE